MFSCQALRRCVTTIARCLTLLPWKGLFLHPCTCIGKGFLAHLDPFSLVNTDKITALTEYLVIFMNAEILDDSVFPAV